MTKGDTVQIIKGKSKGTTGTIFWVGETKYGARVGIKPEDGETVWAKASDVVPVVPTLAVNPAARATIEEIAAGLPAAVVPAARATLSEMAAAMTAASEIDGLRARIVLLEAAVAKLLEASAGAPAPAGDQS
jgi:hypothetical protein